MPPREPLHGPTPETIPNGFASTEWSLVLAASTEGGPALDRLCRLYWRPVYVYIRATGVARQEAEDATQEFFADMLRRDWLKLADRDRGSFRGFLRSSVRLFLNNRRRHAQAFKRGGGHTMLSLETEICEQELARQQASEADPAALYEHSWADCVVEAAVHRLTAEQERAGRSAVFVELRPFLTSAPTPGDYDRIASTFNVSPSQIAVWVHRLTRRFGELIRTEIAETLLDRAEVEAELRYLLQLVARKP
jgi:DNA-directed RNA polymerase specialized sigma24 family protein